MATTGTKKDPATGMTHEEWLDKYVPNWRIQFDSVDEAMREASKFQSVGFRKRENDDG